MEHLYKYNTSSTVPITCAYSKTTRRVTDTCMKVAVEIASRLTAIICYVHINGIRKPK